MKRRIVLAVAALFLCAAPGWAGSPTDELRAFFAAARDIMQDTTLDGKLEERVAAIRALAHQMFDFREAARLALGPDWNERTPAERDHFVQLFSDLLARAFIGGIAGRIQITEDGVRMRFVGEARDGDTATVRTIMVARSGEDLPFDYRMARRDGRWVVRDVSVDGVSLTANYRAQFGRVLQSASFPVLVKQMRDKASPSVAGMLAAAETPRPAAPPVAQAPVAPSAHPRHALTPGAADAGLALEDAAMAPARSHIVELRETNRATREAEPMASSSVVRVAARRDPPVSAGVAAVQARREPETMPSPLRAHAVPVALTVGKDAGSTPALAAVKEPPPPAGPRVTPPAPAVKRPPALGAGYWVQVAAFRNVEAAMRLVATLRDDRTVVPDRWAVTMEQSRPGSHLARVRLGPFADRTAAAASARELEARGYKPFIAEERDSPR